MYYMMFQSMKQCHKPNSKSEEEGTGTRHAVVTEVEFMFLDISWCFCMQYRWAKMTFICLDVQFLSENFYFIPVQKSAEHLQNLFQQSVCLSV
jgi:hypothetical protein